MKRIFIPAWTTAVKNVGSSGDAASAILLTDPGIWALIFILDTSTSFIPPPAEPTYQKITKTMSILLFLLPVLPLSCSDAA